MIQFETTMPGEYSFIFGNFENKFDQSVTMALHTFEAKEEPIEYDFVNNERIIRGTEQDPFKEVIDDIASNQEIYGIYN